MRWWHLSKITLFCFIFPHLYFFSPLLFRILDRFFYSTYFLKGKFPNISYHSPSSSEKSHSGKYSQFFTGYVLLMSDKHLKFNMSPTELITLHIYPLSLYSLYLFVVPIHSHSSQSLKVHLNSLDFFTLHVKYKILFILFFPHFLNNFLPLRTYLKYSSSGSHHLFLGFSLVTCDALNTSETRVQ